MSDKINEHILEELRKDSRIPITRLAERVGRSRTAVQARVEKMEQQQRILRYTILESSDAVEHNIGAVVLITVSVHDQSQTLLQYLRSLPQIKACYGVNGDPSFALFLRRMDRADMQSVVEQIYQRPEVSHTETITTSRQAF